MKALVTGGRRVHRLESRGCARRAGRRRARARQLLDRQPGESRRARRRGRRGRAPLLRARPRRSARHRGRVPPRRARIRAALGAGPAHLERREHRRHAQRAARSARRGRAARVFSSSTSVYGSSRELPTSESTPPGSDLSLRRREARGGALLHQLRPRLRLVRDRRPPLLQRVRAAAEPVLAVRRGRSRSSSRRSTQGEPVTIYGDGEQSRDFTYVGERRRRHDSSGRCAPRPADARSTSPRGHRRA